MYLFVLCVACLRIVCYFVVECDGSCCAWLEVFYWIDHVRSSIECVCCACGPSERLDVPSIYIRNLSPHLGV